MRRTAAIFLLFGLLASSRDARAAGPFGQPGPVMTPDEDYSIEAGYFSYSSKWEPSSKEAFDSVAIRQRHAYLQVTLPSGSVEGYLRVGGADFQEAVSPGSFDSGPKPFMTLGMRWAFLEWPRIGFLIGAVAQGSLYPSYSDTEPVGPVSTATADIHSYFDLGAGLAVQKSLGARIKIYGGPYYFYSQAQGHVNTPTLREDVKTQFQDKERLGVFAGARVALPAHLAVAVEGQFRGNASYGLSLAYSY